MRARLSMGLGLILAACAGSGAQADLENVRTVRSLLAEWALVEQIAAVKSYRAEMRAEAVRQLAAAAAAARRSGSSAGERIAAIASLPADAPLESIRARAAAARRLESRLADR